MRATSRARAALMLSVTAAALVACGKREAPSDAAPSATAPPPSASCPEAQRALEQRVARHSSACTTDSDCTCIDLPQATARPAQKDFFCGLVVPKSQASALREENDRLASTGCAPQATCAQAPCEVLCVPREGGGFCDKRTRCREISIQADVLVKKIELTCKVDGDCVQYPGGIAQNCGGVGNRASVAPILELAREHTSRTCGFAVHCAARALGRPVCLEGMCGEAAR